jgi:glycosyltransferase involved in cell wall biosynthesis
MALATRIVVASRFSERSLLDAGIPAEKIAVIPYGVNPNWFAGGTNGNGAGDRMVFLFVGHVTTGKGVGVLLDAWKRLGASDAELWLAGGGDSAVVQTAQSTPGVRVLGKLGPDELRKAYQGASVFVFPTFCDGFGMVLLEAMSSGLAIIATPNCAAPELVRDGAAGVIFPTGDPAALSAAMADACADRAAWEKRGAAAREIAMSYSWEAYGKRWADLLREVVA